MWTDRFQGQAHRASITPAKVYATANSGCARASINSPLRNSFGRVVYSNPTNAMTISGLLSWCRPSHVTNFIMPILIWVAVDGMLRGRFPSQAFQELIERLKSKLDVVAAVGWKIRMVSVGTPLFGSVICSIFRRTLSDSTLSVRSTRLCGNFSAKTATRPCMFAYKRAFFGEDNSAASAFTEPLTFGASLLACIPQYGQSLKGAIRDVVKASRSRMWLKNYGILVVGHNISLISNIVIRSVRAVTRSTFYIAPQEGC